MSRSKLLVTGLICLSVVVLLGLAVWHGHGPYRFERPAIRSLGPHTVDAWAALAYLLAVPVIVVVLVVSFGYGAKHRALSRVTVYAGLAAAAVVIGELILKPLVDQRYHGQLSFPSGNVTAACATAFAMWMALHRLMGKRARAITFALGAAWTLLMSLAVVGAYWHTPLDDIGSVFLTVGVVATGGAFFEPKATPQPPEPTARALVREGA